jgi:hypothetical protein
MTQEVVIAEWGGRRFAARVNPYGVALIVGPLADSNAEPARAERQVRRMDQDKIEEQLRKLQTDFSGLCQIFAAQQQSLEILGAAVEMHQKTIEVLTGSQPPDPRRAPTN